MSSKQQFEREYMGTFEPSRGLQPPRRPRLAAVLAALTDDAVEWWEWQIAHAVDWNFGPNGVVTSGYMLAAERRDGVVFWRREEGGKDPWTRSITPAEAWELLAARDLIPLSWLDNPRRFGVLGPERCGDCPRGAKPPLCVMCDGTRLFAGALLPHPSTLAEIVFFASLDPEAVERAELLAAEAIQHQRAAAWRFGAVDHEPHGTARRVQALRAINDLGIGTGQTRRGSALAPYAILVCPPL